MRLLPFSVGHCQGTLSRYGNGEGGVSSWWEKNEGFVKTYVSCDRTKFGKEDVYSLALPSQSCSSFVRLGAGEVCSFFFGMVSP